MDIMDFQTRLTDFLIGQVTSGPGNTVEAVELRKELDAFIAAYGDQTPELQTMAAQLDLLAKVQSDPELAASMAVAMSKEYVPNPAIFNAIDDQDLEGVKHALTDWDINQTHGEHDSSALYHAMSSMCDVSLPVVSFLLDRGADPNIGLGPNYNVFHGLGFARIAANEVRDLSQVIKRCIALGADIEQRSNRLRWTPLITAASEWNAEASEALILAGADLDARAGEVDGVCFAGEPARAFAEGHAETMAVFEQYSRPT